MLPYDADVVTVPVGLLLASGSCHLNYLWLKCSELSLQTKTKLVLCQSKTLSVKWGLKAGCCLNE